MNSTFDQLKEALARLEKTCQSGVAAFHFQRLSSLLARADQRSDNIQESLLPRIESGLTDLQALLVKQHEDAEKTEAPQEQDGRSDSVFKGLIERINSFDVSAIDQSSLGLDALLFDEGFDEGLEDKPSATQGSEKKIKINAAKDFQERAKELKSLQFYREQLGKVITENMVRQVIKEDPENAGPLNPQRLLVRTIGAMKDISPAYVNRLVPYYDTLLWLEQTTELSTHKSRASKASAK